MKYNIESISKEWESYAMKCLPHHSFDTKIDDGITARGYEEYQMYLMFKKGAEWAYKQLLNKI